MSQITGTQYLSANPTGYTGRTAAAEGPRYLQCMEPGCTDAAVLGSRYCEEHRKVE